MFTKIDIQAALLARPGEMGRRIGVSEIGRNVSAKRRAELELVLGFPGGRSFGLRIAELRHRSLAAVSEGSGLCPSGAPFLGKGWSLRLHLTEQLFHKYH